VQKVARSGNPGFKEIVEERETAAGLTVYWIAFPFRAGFAMLSSCMASREVQVGSVEASRSPAVQDASRKKSVKFASVVMELTSRESENLEFRRG